MIYPPKRPPRPTVVVKPDIRVLTLKKHNKCWYTLYNPKGQEVCPAQVFRSDSEAEDWARAYISSWLGWEIKIDYGDGKQRNSVPEQAD